MYLHLIGTTLAARPEEVEHELTALVFEDTTDDFGLRVHGPGGVELETTFHVVRTIDDAGDLGPADGTGTHHAGFDGDVEGTLRQVFPSEGVGGGGDGLHLSVGGDVAEGLGEVVGT